MYDYPYKNDNLIDYHIRDIRIKHFPEKIEIKFNKKNLIPAVGILERKIQYVTFGYENELKLYIDAGGGKFKCVDLEQLIYKTVFLTSDELKFTIRSKNYNLKLEAGIICYYDLDDEYDGEILEEVLKEINDTYRIRY